jgi:hypothetical protein|tara:strand:+ start:321 stop:923 length:603 start_codon:yes stop_codon:yes gene_type:complete
MPIAINGSGTVTGISVGGLPDGIVDTDMLANNAVTAAKATGSAKGITMADQWRITSNLAGSASGAYITANWERNDNAGFEKIGTGMSESSGVFSFPETGKYMIMAKCDIYSSRNGYNYYQRLEIHTTQNDSSYTSQATGYGSHAVQYTRSEMSASFIFDVTDVSTHKVKFHQYTYHGDSLILGDSTNNVNNFTFLKIGTT